MVEIRFGGPLGKHLVSGAPTQVSGFGSLELSVEDPAVGPHAVQALGALLGRAGFDVGAALNETSGVQAELEAKLAKDFPALGVRVKMLMLTAR